MQMRCSFLNKFGQILSKTVSRLLITQQGNFGLHILCEWFPLGIKLQLAVNSLEEINYTIFILNILAQTCLSKQCTVLLQYLAWEFVLDIGSWSHWGLTIAPGQETNGDNFKGVFAIFYKIMVCWVYSLESLWWSNSNEYTQHAFSR